MTPKEKAKKLVEQFNCGGLETFAGHNVKVISKQCALIAVDEIIKYRPIYPNNVDWTDCDASYKNYYHAQREQAENYWQDVKQEIEKL